MNTIKKISLFGAFALLALTSCNSSSNKQFAETDSIAAPVDTFDVKAFNSFSSADLKTFGLKGHVKKLEETSGEGEDVIIVFSKEGEAKVVKYLSTDGVIGRDKAGRIATIGTVISEDKEGWFYRFEYDNDGNVVAVNQEIPSYFMTYRTELKKLDDNGWPIECFTQGGEGGTVDRCTETINYSDIDAVGNWTSNIQTGENKSIEMNFDDSEKVTNTEKFNKQTTRKIYYYTQEELKL